MMKNKIFITLVVFTSLAAAPSSIPRVTEEMSRPEFWAAKHPAPDKVVLRAEEIEDLNRKLAETGLTLDIFGLRDRNYNPVREGIMEQVQKFKIGEYYDGTGRKPDEKFIKNIEKNIALDRFWEKLTPRYAVVTAMTDQRLLPTEEILTAKPHDLEFDEIQNSSLDIGTPLHVLLKSQDGNWYYAESIASAGWVKARDVAIDNGMVFKFFYRPEAFVIVTAAKSRLYSENKFLKSLGDVRMGAVFSIQKEDAKFFEVAVPVRTQDGGLTIRTGYLRKVDVHQGFLPYTARTIIEQAFKMFGAPYGWGGMNGEQDCSAFLKMVFATVGIDLPRNSGEQGQTGVSLNVERGTLNVLKKAMPGVTVAQMKGHIVLYLGMHEGRPYAIHAAYAYREPNGTEDITRVVDRVIVSDLDLGKGSKKGSLLERIVSIREIR